MPAGIQILSTGNGPPGGNPGGLTQSVINGTGQPLNRLSIGQRMHEKHKYTHLSIVNTGYTCSLSAKLSDFQFDRWICPRGIHERFHGALVSFYQSRTRLPAYNYNQKPDLRHGCQGSITTNNPIMEE